MRFMGALVVVFSFVSTCLSAQIPVYFALKQYNIPLLEYKLQQISDPTSNYFGSYYTAEDIRNLVEPPISDQRQVLDWLTSNNITSLKNYGDMIKCTAEEKVIDSLLGTHLSTIPKSSGYTIPDHLKSVIDFIELDTKIEKTRLKNYIPTKVTDCDDRFLGRESLVNMYNIKESGVQHRVSGVLAEFQNNGGFSNADLNIQQYVNVQQNNSIYHIQGGNVGLDLESVLDVQLMSEAGDNMDLWFWNSPYWMYSFAADYFNAENIGNIVSMSWGWAEDSQCDIVYCINMTSQDYVTRTNVEFLKMSLRGTTILAASGDAGAPGRTSEGCDGGRPLNPVFPGSSPYVTSVGATYVPVTNKTANFTSPLCKTFGCITSHDEKAISFDKVGWTAGGGFDLYGEHTPWWQNESVYVYLTSGVTLPADGSYNMNGRAYPDVSAIGHSCPIYVDGMMQPLDGTSCSTPVVGGLLAYIEKHLWSAHEKRLGFANPLLYYIQKHCADCFRDVVEGYNWCTEEQCCDPATFGFNATAGYDPVSGLGTLNIDKIIEFIDTQLFTRVGA